ncbi:organic cation transporter protein-like [Pollicipes pollicipes]|uniref:organic cation transporter protein-like n=1 Tax=Pollicipes pollicipes TaxID=41117 RepID=UPI001884A41C|nr:organic cation transporter protein-like [Pollicipes pollicipes]
MARGEQEDDQAEDALLAVIGQKGKWQLITFLVISLLGIPAAWNMLAITFLAPQDVDHWCARPPAFANWTADQWKLYAIPTEKESKKTTYQTCMMYNVSYDVVPSGPAAPAIALDQLTNDSLIACQSWPSGREGGGLITHEYDRSRFPDTAVSEFSLVCDRKGYVAHAQSTYMVGILLGAVLGGVCADWYGRRKTLLIFTVTFLIFGISAAFSNHVIVFMALRFCVAFSMMALFTTGFVYALESVGGSWRAILGISYEYTFAIGFMSLAGIAYGLKPWMHLQLCIVIPAVLFFSFYFIIPESPRWLLSNGREEEARVIIEKICRTNDRPYKPTMEVVDAVSKTDEETRVTILDLFKTPNLCRRTLNFYYNWFVNSFVYYGLSLNSGNLGGDTFINIFIGGAVEIPAYTLSIIVLLKGGRRWALCLSMVIGGVACLCTMIFEKDVYTLDWPIVTCAMIGKFCISASFAIVYVFSAEVFPTVLRTTGVGSSSMCARFGSIAAPYVAIYGGEAYKHLPVIMFGVTSILAGLLALLLPETKGKSLPDTVAQGEVFGTSAEEQPLNKRSTSEDEGETRLHQRCAGHQAVKPTWRDCRPCWLGRYPADVSSS